MALEPRLQMFEYQMTHPFIERRPNRTASPLAQRAAAVATALLLSACTSLGASGPNAGRVVNASETEIAGTRVQVVDINSSIAARAMERAEGHGFAETLGESEPLGAIIGKGDVIDVTIWEAPPAALFGMLNGSSNANPAAITIARDTNVPAQMVDERGQIMLPFVGAVEVAGRTPRQLERILQQHLEGIANQPQVIVSISENASANVTVVGEVATNARVALTPRGERLLDVIASAGGVRQEIGKVTIQVTRGETVASMPLERLVRNPRENVRLRPDDVVAAYYQPFSFTSLGATGINAEIPFEASGITLSQGLGRVSGLTDNKANPRGVFIFRWEDPAVLSENAVAAKDEFGNNKPVPVIYRIDLSDPATFFTAQHFPIMDHDILYVSNAPGVDLQKFVNVLSQGAFSVIGLTNAIIE